MNALAWIGMGLLAVYLVRHHESVLLATRALSRDLVRATLTVLGILIGVASVVTVTAIGSGARDSIASQIQSIGSNFIVIFPQNPNASGARSAQGQGQRLTEEDGRAIVREAVSVKAVAPALRLRAQVISGEHNASTSIIGTSTSFFEVRSWAVKTGDAWDQSDEAAKSKVVVIGTTLRRNLFGAANPIGQNIRIGRYNYRVLGVLESKGEAPFGGDQDDVILMPISSMRTRVMRTAPDFAGALMISATSAEVSDRAVTQINSILYQRHRITNVKEADFVVRTQKEFQKMQDNIYSLMTVMLVLVAAISLIVGGIGVMNIMLVSVTERTREIGIRMAVGARSSNVRSQFLVEAIVVALVGGIAGVAVGALAIATLKALLSWPMQIDGTSVLASVTSSAVTGVLFGFFPAWRASHLDPIVALRRE